MTAELVQKLSAIKDLRTIVETTVADLGQSLNANCCQILLANPIDPNSALIFESYPVTGSGVSTKLGRAEDYPRLTLPLDLNGRGFGTVCLSRKAPWREEEIDSTRLILGKIGEIVRQAQLNDIAQRDTFRDTFLVEINNLMTYSLGVGDALFMVVNILGKALRCSRCLFVCTDDKNSGWKCYEYWQQDKVKSCQENHWPTNDSALIAQTLTSRVPVKFYEGQANSYLTPAQAELQFSDTRSLLALPLLFEDSVYGCVIIQQCDYRRDWTVNEIDMIQSVADRVSEALARLPEEKRIHKPIMQLHQRIVDGAQTGDGAAASLAQSLKVAFGQKSIPSAKDTLSELPSQPDMIGSLSLPTETQPAEEDKTAPEDQSGIIEQKASLENESFKKYDEAVRSEAAVNEPEVVVIDHTELDAIPTPETATAKPDKPSFASLIKAKKRTDKTAASETANSIGPSIVSVQRKNKKSEAAVTQALLPTIDEPTQEVDQSPSAAATQPAIPAVKASPRASKSDLDAIPTPSAAAATSGLSAAMIPKVKVQQTLTSGSPLSASLRKNKSLNAKEANEPAPLATKDSRAEQDSTLPPMDAINADLETSLHLGSSRQEALSDTDSQAREKVERVLSSKSNSKTTGEYIFGLPGIDMRTLGRINGWVEAIEQKDRYDSAHAIAVAEYACAIAKAIDLSEQEIKEIQLAALVHDVGKLGIPSEILQKRDEDLDDAELLTTMRHPIDGAELLKSSPNLAELAPLVLAHHEEYGGNGYPQGLKGDEIPLGARIIHLANSYHAMISNKRSEKGISAEEAQAQLKEQSGIQYDPKLVDAFIQYLNSK